MGRLVDEYAEGCPSGTSVLLSECGREAGERRWYCRPVRVKEVERKKRTFSKA